MSSNKRPKLIWERHYSVKMDEPEPLTLRMAEEVGKAEASYIDLVPFVIAPTKPAYYYWLKDFLPSWLTQIEPVYRENRVALGKKWLSIEDKSKFEMLEWDDKCRWEFEAIVFLSPYEVSPNAEPNAEPHRLLKWDPIQEEVLEWGEGNRMSAMMSEEWEMVNKMP